MSDSEAKPKIMVVDDTIANLKLLEEMLGKQGYAVTAFPLGRLALEAAARDLPDLVLLDIHMPEWDGYEVCERFKADPRLAPIPIIFVSAQHESVDKVKAFAAGAVDYVTKPFHFAEVEARVRTHIDLRRQKLALQESYQRLKEQERLRDNLAHMVVHDMRSPLFAVLMALDLIKINVPQPTEKASKYLQMAVNNVTKLTEMVTQLLDVSRLESGNMPLKKARGDLGATVQSALDSMSSLTTDRRVIFDAPQPIFASFDRDVVGRVVANLVGNALKFTMANDVVKIALARAGTSAHISVTDHGPGIPAQFRESIFEKFSQIDGEKRKYGAGLGLTFCKLAVEAHGGGIGVESGAEEGNTFWFTLPLVQ